MWIWQLSIKGETINFMMYFKYKFLINNFNNLNIYVKVIIIRVNYPLLASFLLGKCLSLYGNKES
jgi:hypothetical protein